MNHIKGGNEPEYGGFLDSLQSELANAREELDTARKDVARVDYLESQISRSQLRSWREVVDEEMATRKERDDLRAKLDTAEKVGKRHQWQPIETAPMGGPFPLLGIVKGERRLIYYGKTSHIPLYGWNVCDQGPEDCELCEPTHWQPLPEPPSEALAAMSAERPVTEP